MWMSCALAVWIALLPARDTDGVAIRDPVPSSDWSRFRGPDGQGIAGTTDALPDSIDPQRNLAWKIPIPPGHSSPIVVGEHVFLTAFEPGKLLTLCVDRASGVIRWQREVDAPSFERFHPQHGPASSTPCSDGERVFALFGSFGLIAYDLDGNELWRAERPIQSNTFGSASSPVLIDGSLIMLCGSEQESLLQAIDPATGSVRWERRRPGPASSWSTPVPLRNGDEPVGIVFYEPFHLRACALADGTDWWSVPGLADEPITTPQIENGLIITTSYNLRTNQEAIGLPTFDALLSECDADGDGAIDAEEAKSNRSILSRPDADGEGDHPLRMFFRMLDADRDGKIQAMEWPKIREWMEPWAHANGLLAIRPEGARDSPVLQWQHEVGVPECPTPLIWGDRVFAIRNGGVVTCLELASGAQRFQERLVPGGPYYASPVAGDGKIYVASERGAVSVLSAESIPRLLATVDLDEKIWATPALSAGSLFLRSEQHLWRFDAAPRPTIAN